MREKRSDKESSFPLYFDDSLRQRTQNRGLKAIAQDVLFTVKPEIHILFFVGRVVLLLIIVIWGISFIVNPMASNYAGRSFMHMVNLPFHEAGHIIFSPFGKFISTLGGSLMQVLVPLICIIVFLVKTRDAFAATVSLWWLSESLMDLAPYINDARSLQLVLLGGVTGRDVEDYHDWEYILRRLGMLECDHILATIAHIFGIVLMLLAFAWGGYLLFRQYENIETS
ncbi:MAG: hypothetical protein JSV13_09355 [Nitrospiraceae bacterium]|nr:MAG: hypothetical protein JSV13_09355 [Nitrospiraceae bacterium]